MSNGMAEMAGTNEWGSMLEETRQALSTLRVKELEKLADRAEKMFDASVGPRQQGRPGLCEAELFKVTREHRLLGDLLLATDSNLRVLRRLGGNMDERTYVGGVNSRWVR